MLGDIPDAAGHDIGCTGIRLRLSTRKQSMNTTVEWIRADERLPYDGAGILAAVTGRYPGEQEDDPESLSGQEFWLVLPMYFRRIHPVEETGEIIENCFYDSDGVVRFPIGGPTCEEMVTHWAEMPSLPGMDVQRVYGKDVGRALRALPLST
ncbi:MULTISPECIES: AQJ64_40280 family protein [unclassified Streptomyces]|uniref:AQJ64_40280 family protein n=2 Tax=Streptomyces TaxID=1883 RepID=UPI0024766BB9|nr:MULTISPECIES: AQJ64_40280 family protein [unclassified Streptomyces]